MTFHLVPPQIVSKWATLWHENEEVRFNHSTKRDYLRAKAAEWLTKRLGPGWDRR